MSGEVKCSVGRPRSLQRCSTFSVKSDGPTILVKHHPKRKESDIIVCVISAEGRKLALHVWLLVGEARRQ